jgi:citrate lyase subunit beta/citryl-CoA lyase
VPDPYKEDARKLVRSFLKESEFSGHAFVRVSPIDSGLLSLDMEAALCNRTTGLMFTKVRDELDIVYLDKMLAQYEHDLGFENGKFKMLPLIEVASAVIRSYQIAVASERVVGLAFGAEDYLTDLDGLHKEHGASLLVPRSLIVMAARAARIDALDTPYLDVRNIQGYRREVEQARELGFSGQLVLHPKQIDIPNEIFSPSKQEIEEATRIVAAIDESSKEGKGVTLLDGKLIGPPMLKRAVAVLDKAKKVERLSNIIVQSEK